MKINLQKHLLEVFVFGTLIYIIYQYISHVNNYDENTYLFESATSPKKIKKSPNVKYVLISTLPTPIFYIGKGNTTFQERNCSFQNCTITDVNIFRNVSAFDAILIHDPELLEYKPEYYMPIARPTNQIYIFASRESSDNYGVSDTRYNGVFNYTWTYKLDSDINFAYMIIRDEKGRIVGPNVYVPWMSIEDMSPINDSLKDKLDSKSIAAAWFVSNCDSKSGRERIVELVVEELSNYNMTVDVYGVCRGFNRSLCPAESMDQCMQKLQRDYYFYLAFENSFSDDYVTEQLLIALRNYAVPIVYGRADYKRFMPDGIYLDIHEKSVEKTVNQMVEIIENKSRYYELFKWHNHYSYHLLEEQPATDPYCAMCSFLHNVDYNKPSVVDDFYTWWNDLEQADTQNQ